MLTHKEIAERDRKKNIKITECERMRRKRRKENNKRGIKTNSLN